MSAYEWALADFFGKPEVLGIDICGWTGEVGQTLRIQARDYLQRVLLDADKPAPWEWLAACVEWMRQYVDGTLLAKIHGCTAPLYFALCTVAVVLTSRRWRR